MTIPSAMARPLPPANAALAGFWRQFAGLFLDGLVLSIVAPGRAVSEG